MGKPEIKHSNNKVTITIYIYNRKKIYFLNKIKKLLKIHATRFNKFNKSKLHRRGINPYKLTKIKDYKLIISLILVKDFKFRLNLTKSVSLRSLNNDGINLNQNKSLSKTKFKLKSKKLSYNKLKLLKKKKKKTKNTKNNLRATLVFF
jgi:hypothetical protein